MPGPYIVSRPLDTNSWNPLSGSGGYYDLWQLFAQLRTTAGQNSVPTAYTGILSAGKDLSEIFDPSMSAEDQINFLTGFNTQPGGNYPLSGADLKFIFRNINITPTPSVTPAATPTPTPSITPSITPTITPTPSKTPSVTPSLTPTPSVTSTPGPTTTPSVTPTPSITPTSTPSVTPTVTPSISVSTTPGVTPTSSPIPPSSTPTPTVTPSVSITPSLTPTPSVTSTPNPTTTPTPTPTVTPTITPTPTPSITPSNTPVASPPAVTLTLTGEESVRWYGNNIPLQSTATATGGQIASYVLQVRHSPTGTFTSSYETFAVYSGSLPTTNAVFPVSYTPNQGVGFYQFNAFVTVVGNSTTYSFSSGVVAVINNNTSVTITSTSPTAGSTSINLTSIADSSNSTYPLTVHGFEWYNGTTWINIGEFYPNTQTSVQTLTHNAGSFGTYFYRAYTSNCSDFRNVGTYQYSNTITVTFTDVPPSPTPSPSPVPPPTPTPTPSPVFLTWVNQNLTSPDQFSSIWIKKYFTSGSSNSYNGQLFNPSNIPITVTTSSNSQYGINFGSNTTLQILGNNLINFAGNYDGSIARSSSETYNRLVVTPTTGQEFWLDIILPASCYWSSGDSISGDTYTATSIWANNVGGYITQQGTITNPNPYSVTLFVDSIINSSGSVTWWQTSPGSPLTTGSAITIAGGSTVVIGFSDPSVSNNNGVSEIVFKGPNQLLNFRAELYNILQWVVNQNTSAGRSAWFTSKYVWDSCTPTVEVIEGYNVVYAPIAGTYQFQAEVDDSLELYVDGNMIGSIASFQESYKSETPIIFNIYLNVGVHVIRTVATNELQAYGAGVAVELWDPSNNVIWSLRNGSSGPYLNNPGAGTCIYNDNTYGDVFTDTNNFVDRVNYER